MYSLYVESIPLVISIVDELEAVDVDIKFNDPPEILAGILVIADRELLLHTLIDMCYSYVSPNLINLNPVIISDELP
jgi:hypothetical protein